MANFSGPGLAALAIALIVQATAGADARVRTGLKTARDCAREVAAYQITIDASGETPQAFIAACRATPVGQATLLVAGTPPPVSDDAYKLGFMFTPAFLSSPQVIGRAMPQFQGTR